MQEKPIYQKIALDIAQRITAGEFTTGSKISGRSILSGEYKVSPETIRKATSMLRSAKVLSVSQGKESIVLSIIDAYKFVEENKKTESLYSFKERYNQIMAEKKKVDIRLKELFLEAVNHSNRFKDISPYNPIELELSNHCYMVDKSVSETCFWQHTKTTVIAIRRNGAVIISPGPDEKLRVKDKIVIVGTIEAISKALTFINKGSKK